MTPNTWLRLSSQAPMPSRDLRSGHCPRRRRRAPCDRAIDFCGGAERPLLLLCRLPLGTVGRLHKPAADCTCFSLSLSLARFPLFLASKPPLVELLTSFLPSFSLFFSCLLVSLVFSLLYLPSASSPASSPSSTFSRFLTPPVELDHNSWLLYVPSHSPVTFSRQAPWSTSCLLRPRVLPPLRTRRKSTRFANASMLARQPRPPHSFGPQGYPLPNGATGPVPGAAPLLPNNGRIIQNGPVRVLCIADVRGRLPGARSSQMSRATDRCG